MSSYMVSSLVRRPLSRLVIVRRMLRSRLTQRRCGKSPHLPRHSGMVVLGLIQMLGTIPGIPNTGTRIGMKSGNTLGVTVIDRNEF